METSINLSGERISNSTKATSKNSNASFWQNAERYRFAIMPMLLVIIGCLGGIAAAYGAQSDALKLAIISIPAAISLALTLALSPMRVIFYVSIIAVLLDLLVFVF